MTGIQPKYAMDDFARRGEEVFTRCVADKVRSEDPDRIVAIDIESGDFEVDSEMLGAADRLRLRRPDAQIWMRRVGSRSVIRFGFRHGTRET